MYDAANLFFAFLEQVFKHTDTCRDALIVFEGKILDVYNTCLS